MNPGNILKWVTRRDILRSAGKMAGGWALSHSFPNALGAALRPPAHTAAAPAPDALAEARARFGKIPITAVKLSDNLTLLTGPGGNVVVLHGPDGKLLVDTFTQLAWERFKNALDELGSAPLKFVVDSHWHWDHTDNNANVRAAGATLIAHGNTLKRLKETHDLDVINLHFDPCPENALPERTFRESFQMHFNGSAWRSDTSPRRIRIPTSTFTFKKQMCCIWGTFSSTESILTLIVERAAASTE